MEASRIVQEALESKEIDPATEAALTAVAVRAALARGDAATARRLFGRARLASPAATASRSRAFDALETMLAHAEGRRAEALAMARELRRAAASDPFPIYAQVEILAASIEKKVGDRRDGIARLAALATDAADHGMILVARQARAQ